MQILGAIVVIVGVVLFLIGRNVKNYTPPAYQGEEDDGFRQLLISVGNMFGIGGIIFFVFGMVIVVLGFMASRGR